MTWLAALLLQAAQPAIQPAAPPRTLSAEGRATAERMLAEQEGRAAALRARVDAAGRDVQRAAAAQPLDLVALRQALGLRDALLAEQVRARTEAALALLEQLSPDDRAAVARFVAAAPTLAAPAPSLPGTPPQR